MTSFRQKCRKQIYKYSSLQWRQKSRKIKEKGEEIKEKEIRGEKGRRIWKVRINWTKGNYGKNLKSQILTENKQQQ